MLPPALIQETDKFDDTLNHDINSALTETEQQQEETMKQHRAQEELLYDNLEETAPIPVSDGQVTFCRHFKYLGSYVSFCLCDDYDIDKRIAAASQAMGALKTMWDCPHLELWNKYLLVQSTPMNILLWGCETWSMCKALANKLEVFLHCSICRILHVTITRVKEEHIRNEHVQKMFYDIPCIGNMIAARQMDFIGKIVRASPDCLAQPMLTACCDNIRPVGRPFLHTKDYIIKNLRLLFANVPEVTIDDFGSLKS